MKPDPKQVAAVVSGLSALIYAEHDKSFKEDLHDIIKANARAIGSQQLCFIFRTQVYGAEFYKDQRTPWPVDRLAMHLRPRMEALLKSKAELEMYERPCIEGFLTEAVTATQNVDDLMQLLPDSMHNQMRTEVLINLGFHSPIKPTKLAELKTRFQPYPRLIRLRMATSLLEGR